MTTSLQTSTLQHSIDFNKYVGIPFANHGRTKEGFDCYGLAIEFYKNEFNIDLPDLFYSESNDKLCAHSVFKYLSTKFVLVDEPKFGDIVAIKLHNFIIHVGIYLREDMVLHSIDGSNSCIEDFSQPTWAKRIGGYYRWMQ
jgi:cell wall-associated NlpC family hydrolase